MTWGKPNSEEGFKFKEEVLPPGALDALKSTPLQEARGGSVIHKKSTESASSGALRDSAAGSGSANTQVILPRHRAAVERYFERKSSPLRGNPKSEIRKKTQNQNHKTQTISGFPLHHWDFFRISDFGFRISAQR